MLLRMATMGWWWIAQQLEMDGKYSLTNLESGATYCSEWAVKVFEEGVFCVFFGEDGFGGVDSPVNAEGVVENGDASVGFGVVELVAFVLEYGYVAEHGEAVGESLGDEELEVIVFG